MNFNNVRWLKEGAIDLLVESYSSTALTLQIRGLNDNEMIIADHATSSNRSLVSESIAITSPPRMLTVRAASTGVKRGTCYVRISLRVEGVIMALLFADYVTDSAAPAFPNGRIMDSTEGPGLLRSFTGTDPAAGVEISETVPTAAKWRFISARTVLTTSATVANRRPIFVVDDGTETFYSVAAAADITAGSATAISIIDTFGTAASPSGVHAINMPRNIMLSAGYRIRTTTSNLQADDNYIAPRLLVEEWIQP